MGVGVFESPGQSMMDGSSMQGMGQSGQAEGGDAVRSNASERSCWCLNPIGGSTHFHLAHALMAGPSTANVFMMTG